MSENPDPPKHPEPEAEFDTEAGRPTAKAPPGGRSGSLKKHFEGWQSAVVVVVLALLSTRLFARFDAVPIDLPIPRADGRELKIETHHVKASAGAAARDGLSVEIRSVGELMRKHSVATESTTARSLFREIRRAVGIAHSKDGEHSLIPLRDLQTELFVAAVDVWVETGKVNKDLTELGANFVNTGLKNKWGGPRESKMSHDDLRAFFRIHWAKLSGQAQTFPYAPSLSDWRLFYSFLLRHPPMRVRASPVLLMHHRLATIKSLSQIDSEYPVQFANGIARYQGGDYGAAEKSFERHLLVSPDGPWTLRAQNHRAAALARSEGR